jgi:hypothetical protein
VSSFFKFLRRVRIHGRECGAVARALRHKIEVNPLSAADKKVLSTTNERKVMSNSTFFKRIALTAIAALGFGMLSVAPSSATVTAHTLTIDSATDAISLGDTATAVLSHSFVNLNAEDSVTIRAIVTSSNASSAGQIFMSVNDSFTSAGNTAATNDSPEYTFTGSTAGVNDANQALLSTKMFPSFGSNYDSVVIGPTNSGALRTQGTTLGLKLYNPTRAGTYVVSVYTLTSESGATAVSATPTVSWTVTVTEPSRKAEASSTVTLRQGDPTTTSPFDGTAQGTDSQTIAAATDDDTDLTAEFSLFVVQKSLTSTTTAAESYTVSVSGEAYVSATDTARPTAGNGLKGLTMAHQTPSSTVATQVYIWSTGNAGTATITATTASGLLLGTKTVTFYGDVAKLEINSTTYDRSIVRAGGFTSPTLFFVKATDAAGNTVQDVNPTIVSSDVSVITSGSCTDASSGISDGISACTVTSAIGSVSGGKATLTIRTLDPARAAGTTSYLTVTKDVTLGGSVSTEVITLDKTSYSPGEWMVVTVTAKDSSGNPVWDGATAPTLTANKATGGTITMTTYVGGVSTSTTKSATTGLVTNASNLGAPAVSGSFTVSGLSGNATATPISVTGTVGDDAATAAANAASDAAAEAIDAANAATDAANLAAEAADAATVAAEEARDAADAATAAVEALATEVATLMAALKAQITTLANTVAKIAKKVKA